MTDETLPDDYDPDDTVYATDPDEQGTITVGSPDEYDEPYHNPTRLYHEYHILKKSTHEIADEFGVSNQTILGWMDRHDIDRRDMSKAVKLAAHGSNRPWEDEDWLRTQHVDEKKSTLQIADEQGVSHPLIHGQLVAFGIERRWEDTRRHTRDAKFKDHEWLEEQYVDQKRPATDIATDEGVAVSTIYRELEKAGIERRSKSEAQLVQHEREMAVHESRVPRPDGDTDVDGTDPENTVTSEGGNASYTGPSGGINLAWSDASEVNQTQWVPYWDEQWLRWQYHDRGKSISEMADICECGNRTIRKWMERYDIERRQSGGPEVDENAPYRDEQWLRNQYHDRGRSAAELADICGCHSSTIYWWMDRYNIERRQPANHTEVDENAPYRDEQWLRCQYHELGNTTYEIADVCGCSDGTIRKWMDRYDIERRQPGDHTDTDENAPYRDEQWLRRQYHDRDQSTYEMAEACGCSRTTIRKWMDRYGIERRPSGDPEVDENPSYRDEQWLRRQYHDLGNTIREMAEAGGCSRTTIQKWMDRYDIERRQPGDHTDADDNTGGGDA